MSPEADAARIGAIVLAAGRSSRMGRPKALLPLEGRTFLGALLGRLLTADIMRIVVVLGEDAGEILRAADPGYAIVVRNPDPSRGQLSSVHCGLDALEPFGIDAFFLAPVDVPRVHADTLRLLMAALPGHPLVVPTYKGRRGHPPLFSWSLVPALRAAPLSEGARTVVRATSGIVELPVDDPGVVDDFDRPEDLKRM